MELFKNTNYDFLGKKWPFIIASLVLTVAGFASILMQGGLKFGIDFKGGTLMTVKFGQTPPLEKIRTASARSGKIKGEVTVQSFTDPQTQNEVEIGTELVDERQLAANRQAMEEVLAATFAQPGSGKLEMNSASKDALAGRLRDALARNGVPMAEPQLQKLAAAILSFRDTQPRSGLITDFNQLTSVPGVNAGIMNTLKQEMYLAPYTVKKTEMVVRSGGAK
jgi:preprotein translocase subunit SecF